MRKIVWAIDALDKNEKLQPMAEALRQLTCQRNIKIEPIFVSGSSFNKRQETRASARIDKLIIPGKTPLTILFDEHSSAHSRARKIFEYASHSKADLITFTARPNEKDFGREESLSSPLKPRLDPFSERLLTQSNLPLFIVGERAVVPKHFRNLFFPTDFTEEGKKSLEAIITLSKDFHARVTLYHDLKCFRGPIALYSSDTARADCFENSKEMLIQEGEVWREFGKRKGCEMNVVIDSSQNDLAKAITTKAQETHADLIVMTSHSGYLTSELFGNVTQAVISFAPCPVWVIHPSISSQKNEVRERAAG